MNEKHLPDEMPYSTWRAPDAAPEFRARVWQRIEARRSHPFANWIAFLADSRAAYAGALAATAMVWLAILFASPAPDGHAHLFSPVEPGTLTAAFAQALHGR